MKPRLMSYFLMLILLALVACGGQQPTPAATTAADEEPAATIASEQSETTADAPPIQIGLITDLTGPFITFGKDIEVATNYAVEQVNANGGINGSMLEVVLFDSGGQPEQAVVGLRELVNQGVFAISGPLSSGEAEVAFAQVAQLEIPTITGTANKEGITELGGGWAFRNTATNTALYTEAMPVWAEAYGIETAVLIYDEAEPVTSAAALFAIPAVAQQVGIEIVNADAPITFARGQTDFSTTVQRIMETEADGLIIMSVPTEAGLIARELVRQGETRPVIGHPAQYSNTFFTSGGSDINEWVLPIIFNPASTDADTAAYVATMNERDQEPPTVPEASNYYDNIMMLAQVMRDAGIDGNTAAAEARALIRDGLLALSDYDGVAGQTTFGGSGDADKSVYVTVIRAGAVELLR